MVLSANNDSKLFLTVQMFFCYTAAVLIMWVTYFVLFLVVFF